MQTALFTYKEDDQVLNDLFQAYFDARKNKRNTINALKFEKHFEHNLFALHDEIISFRYEPQPSICFVVDKPVKREIFAADFRDRVVHHLLYNYLSPIFEKRFIHDSYSCRKGKGTHYGIRRIDHFMRSCSENYTKDCYILKLDIKGYFMAMDRSLLYSKVKSTIAKQSGQFEFDLNLVLFLLEKVIFNDPTRSCIVKGKENDWDGLPPSKSLFHASSGKGLPIGNLTSQLFGNVYLNDFDHYVKRDLAIRYYGRYVDDFVLIHPDKHYLIRCISYVKDYLKNELMLDLHPTKIYLQPLSKGVKYLGAVILPHRIYLANRTKGNFYESIKKHSAVARDHKPDIEERKAFLSSINSYLGIARHYKTYKLRKRFLFNDLSCWWWNHAYVSGGYAKIVLKNKMN